MNDTTNDAFVKQAEALEKDGAARFKENWPTFVSAIDKALPKNIARSEVIKAALAQDDPASAIAHAGRESLLALAGSDDRGIAREAADAYAAIRQTEKEKFRAARGRR